MKILICSLAIVCNIIVIRLESAAMFNQPSYSADTTPFLSGIFLIISTSIGIIATSGLTTLAWYWNIPIYIVGYFILSPIIGMITDNTIHFALIKNRPWVVYIWGLTAINFILAVCGYIID